MSETERAGAATTAHSLDRQSERFCVAHAKMDGQLLATDAQRKGASRLYFQPTVLPNADCNWGGDNSPNESNAENPLNPEATHPSAVWSACAEATTSMKKKINLSLHLTIKS